MTVAAGTSRLRAVEAQDAAVALAEALAGGPPIAVLPQDRAERARARSALRPAVAIQEHDPAAVVLTSGSTGAPKAVVLSRAAIRASAAATHARLGGPGDWLLALPARYVAGLMVLARAAIAGTRVIEIRSDLADLVAAGTDAGRPRYLSLVPTQLSRALREPVLTAALTGVDAVLVGGGAADPAVLARARAAGIAVVTTYGLSETCGGCVYDGRPLDGVRVEIAADGRIGIAGPTVFSGYRLDPDRTADRLRAGVVRTDDRGRWVGGPAAGARPVRRPDRDRRSQG